eukprot:COSAG06_NODE_11218_length_1543_cov_0.940443_2_plen_393_part_01
MRDLSASCPMLLHLEGGCSYDLHHDDPDLPVGTRVSEVCPVECSGYAACGSTALDLSFFDDQAPALSTTGNVCIDGGGAVFDGGYAQLDLDGQYASGAEFSLSFWILKEAEDVWDPTADPDSALQALFVHTPRDPSLDASIKVWLGRSEWLHAWTLYVRISGAGMQAYEVPLSRDALPQWTHISIVVENDSDGVTVFEDAQLLRHKVNVGCSELWASNLDLTDMLMSDDFYVNPENQNLTAGDYVLVVADPDALQHSYDGTGYSWAPSMSRLCGTWREVTVPRIVNQDFNSEMIGLGQHQVVGGTTTAVGVGQAAVWYSPRAFVAFRHQVDEAPEVCDRISHDERRLLRLGSTLGDQVHVGATPRGFHPYRGSVAMLQVYASALTEGSVDCVF